MRRGLENVIGSTQLSVLAFQTLQLGEFVGGDTRPTTRIDLRATHPQPHRLRLRTELLRDRTDRLPLRPVLVPMVQDHPHRTLPQLIGILPMIRHDSILLKGWSLHQTRGASSRPGFGAVNRPGMAGFDAAAGQRVAVKCPRNAFWRSAERLMPRTIAPHRVRDQHEPDRHQGGLTNLSHHRAADPLDLLHTVVSVNRSGCRPNRCRCRRSRRPSMPGRGWEWCGESAVGRASRREEAQRRGTSCRCSPRDRRCGSRPSSRRAGTGSPCGSRRPRFGSGSV
jgi:hypothetical protein